MPESSSTEIHLLPSRDSAGLSVEIVSAKEKTFGLHELPNALGKIVRLSGLAATLEKMAQSTSSAELSFRWTEPGRAECSITLSLEEAAQLFARLAETER